MSMFICLISLLKFRIDTEWWWIRGLGWSFQGIVCESRILELDKLNL
ncbi:hypothetical protein GLYMA_09G110950v4 [Glycine max]|nr:hypothetical protein GLYMA_09G110950v4 [Glycine max]KAH1042501.1 hypothetical protein GYH30_024688 [Glycine max]